MMRKWLLFVVACLVFGLSLVVHAPARLVVPEQIGKLRFVGVGGSLWRGEGQQIVYSRRALPVGTLNWKIRPAAMLTGTLEADLYEQQTPGNRGRLGMNLLSRQFELRALHWQLPAESLDPWFQAWIRLRGQFVLDLQTLQLAPNNLLSSQLDGGRLEWQSATLQVNSENWQVGAPVLQVSAVSGAIKGVVANAQPLLPGNSSFQCTTESCRAEVNLQPAADAPQSLLNVLLFLGLQQEGDTFSGQMIFPFE